MFLWLSCNSNSSMTTNIKATYLYMFITSLLCYQCKNLVEYNAKSSHGQKHEYKSVNNSKVYIMKSWKFSDREIGRASEKMHILARTSVTLVSIQAHISAAKAKNYEALLNHFESPHMKIYCLIENSRFFSSFLALAWLPWDCWFEEELMASCPFDAFCSCLFTTGTSEISFSSIPMSRICCSRFSAADKCWIGADRAFTKSEKKPTVVKVHQRKLKTCSFFSTFPVLLLFLFLAFILWCACGFIYLFIY